MSTGDWPQDDAQQEPPKKGSSGLKIVLIILGIGGGLVVLCCGGLYLWGRDKFSVTVVPAEVTARSKEIAEIDIPASFAPAMAMKMNIPGTPAVNMVVYISGAQSGSLMLIDLSVPPGQGNTAALEQQMIHSMSQQRQGEQIFHELKIEETDEEVVEIRGQPATIEYVTGADRDTGDPYKQATVRFPGKAGSSTTLLVQLPADAWDQDEVRKMIESIK